MHLLKRLVCQIFLLKVLPLLPQYKDFTNTVISMAGTVAGAATGNHAKEVEEEECGGEGAEEPNNGTLADAAVAYAWETKEMGNGNDGTQLYRAVKDAVAPNDTWIYQSCDRGVATAVRWSGAGRYAS